jgi:hypothetical protein
MRLSGLESGSFMPQKLQELSTFVARLFPAGLNPSTGVALDFE